MSDVFKKQCGDFKIETWSGGWPRWVELFYSRSERSMRFSSDDLSDLKYLVDKALEAIAQDERKYERMRQEAIAMETRRAETTGSAAKP
jgi:hypothetical protein